MKKTVYYSLIVLFLILSATVEGLSEDRYGYEKKDTLEEQKRFVAKLKEDNKKADMAIKNTKTLIDRSRNRPYLPELYLRLAELYIEKSRLVYFIRNAEVSDSQESLTQLESKILKNHAIEIYQRILDNFPDFDSRDRVHFFMAHEYRELGQIDDMIKQYQIIATRYRSSKYAPEAYLLLGDHYIKQLDLPLAEKHYRAVLDYPQSPALSIARYKLAWVHINNSDFKAALQLLEDSIESNPARDLDIDTYKRVDIKLESLIDMAYCYTEVHKDKNPQEAIGYFKKYSWSRPVYTSVLEKLAYRYFIKKKWNHAAVIYRHLSELQQDSEKLLEYARNIFECVQAMGTYENADHDMTYIVKALQRQKSSVHIPQDEKEKNITDYEVYARNIVTHLHEKARKHKSVPDFKRAADAYKSYMSFFEKSPVYEEMQANYGEALFSSKQYIEAGKVYEEMSSRIFQGDKQKEEILYSAATAYYKALKQKHDLNYYQVAFARSGLKNVGKQYASKFPASLRVPDILFNVAWISYDEGKYDEAIEEFIKFIDRYPGGKAAEAAIHLTLDAFNLKEDYEGLIAFGQQIIKDSRIVDAALKADVSRIISASESRILSSFTVTAMDDWEKGRESLVKFVEEKKSSGLGEQVLNTLIVTSSEKGDLETLFSTGGNFIAEYSHSSKIADTLGILIDSSVRISQFRILAEYLEKFEKIFPDHGNAKEFLLQAADIRRRLGQYALSNRDYKRLLNRVQNNRDESEKIIFAVTDNLERMDRIDDAIDFLKKKKRYLSKVGKIKADALLSSFYFEQGKLTEFSSYQKKASQSYTHKNGEKDNYLRDLMARTVYNSLEKTNHRYMTMQLGNHIDNKLVTAKSKLLEKLEKDYLDIILYKSPEWALKAFYRAHEVNKEFARFIRHAPVPDLSPEEKKQYLTIVNDRANKYVQKADEYLKTIKDLTHKWDISNMELARYFPYYENQGRVSFFSESNTLVEIGVEFLRDGKLKNLHDALMKNPQDAKMLLSLAKGYLDRGDYGQSVLIARKALDDLQANDDLLKADFYNLIGISQLYRLNDTDAKKTLKKALKIDPRNIGATINLAGLYQHYGDTVNAKKMYKNLPNTGLIKDSTDLIHPKAKEFYDAYINGS